MWPIYEYIQEIFAGVCNLVDVGLLWVNLNPNHYLISQFFLPFWPFNPFPFLFIPHPPRSISRSFSSSDQRAPILSMRVSVRDYHTSGSGFNLDSDMGTGNACHMSRRRRRKRSDCTTGTRPETWTLSKHLRWNGACKVFFKPLSFSLPRG